MSFLSRYLTKTEKKWGEIERTVSLVSWALRKLRRYSTYAEQITIIVPWEETLLVILEKQQHHDVGKASSSTKSKKSLIIDLL